MRHAVINPRRESRVSSSTMRTLFWPPRRDQRDRVRLGLRVPPSTRGSMVNRDPSPELLSEITAARARACEMARPSPAPRRAPGSPPAELPKTASALRMPMPSPDDERRPPFQARDDVDELVSRTSAVADEVGEDLRQLVGSVDRESHAARRQLQSLCAAASVKSASTSRSTVRPRLCGATSILPAPMREMPRTSLMSPQHPGVPLDPLEAFSAAA
jgi:hypothetical protein